MALLRELFKPEEADIAAGLPFKPVRLEKLAEKLGRDAKDLGQTLAELARRGLLYERVANHGRYYSLLPIAPGMAELQFMAVGPDDDEDGLKRLARLFDDYYRPGVGRSLTEAAVPYSRVIPIGRTVEGKQSILPFEQAEDVLRSQSVMALTDCYCRREASILGKACGAPLDVCMIFGPFAEYAMKKGLAKPLDLAGGIKTLERAEDAGLVHVTDNVASGSSFMCNCCGCCCVFLKTITQLKSPGSVAAASLMAEIDVGECTQCEACQDVCQVGAVSVNDAPAVVNPELCLGCGLCERACAFDAVSMIPREIEPPAANFQALHERLARGRSQN
jgi:Pyruvate/2-oxoacid:ferredoxin oxidoreductase delta subunit